MAEGSSYRLTFIDHTLINIIPVQALSYFTLYEAWNGHKAPVIQWHHSQRKRGRQPILFTALQTTNYAHIVKPYQITMHNEACSRTVINSDSSNWPADVEPTAVTGCFTHS